MNEEQQRSRAPSSQSPVFRSQASEAAVARRGMTLIEILIVMSVMVILVSAIVVAVFRISGKAQVHNTHGLFDKLAVGLQAYRSTYRMYPPMDPNDPNSPMDVGQNTNPIQTPEVEASSEVLWMALEYQGQGQFMSPVSSSNKVQGGALTDPVTGASQPWYYYVDGWQNPILYLCPAPFLQYTLRSAGPDLILYTADDIVTP
jgi:prepilin-type N-terminal cleavage/methylation domain-containing protein